MGEEIFVVRLTCDACPKRNCVIGDVGLALVGYNDEGAPGGKLRRNAALLEPVHLRQKSYGMTQSQNNGPDPVTIAEAIETALRERDADKTVCPSEVARTLVGSDEKLWRLLMKPIKVEAMRLAREGRVDIRRKGRSVAPDGVKGIYRIGLPVVEAATKDTPRR